jgi:hypothetical protein
MLSKCNRFEALGARDIVSKLSKRGLDLAVKYRKVSVGRQEHSHVT